MAMLRHANAAVVPSRLYDGGWDKIRVASGHTRQGRSLVDQASKILKADFDPKHWLLTHCTIVASVDVEKVPGVKLGSSTVDGKQVVRKTASFRINSESDIFVNNNLDAWSRPVLLKSYPTFVGGHNFQEHVQIEELSKGRILDAVARDIGPSVYVDILVATNRKHAELIKDIESGEMSTLSMGCSIDGSTCTKCGHWAADETEMCEHIRYAKGNTFFDEKGVKHRIAELCGDESLDPTGGVTFIEASWVKVPAFKGAVARNVVTLAKDAKTAYEIQTTFTEVPVVNPEAVQKAASEKVADDYVPDDMPVDDSAPAEPGSDTGEAPSVLDPPADKSPFSDVEDELTTSLIEKVRKRVKDQISKSKADDLLPTANDNNNMLREANEKLEKEKARSASLVKVAKAAVYKASLRAIVASSRTDIEVVERIATLNYELGISVPQSVYRAVLRVGPTDKYGSLNAYLEACKTAIGKQPSVSDTKTLIRLGTLLSAHGKRS